MARTATFVFRATLLGLLAAVVTVDRLVRSWNGCEAELDPGNRLGLAALTLAALVALPAVAAVSTALAAGARSAFSDSPFGWVLGATLLALGALILLGLAAGCVVLGDPPTGYCTPFTEPGR